ncbi:MAG TPA: DinB family protein [Thermoanaerobaculia bacterium]|nr:DinB family protein [Thermoanaerobaculia bacterium]
MPKDKFLAAYEEEHQKTMNVLRAYPSEQADLRPHPKCKTAKELAWVFVLERGLGTHVMNDAFASSAPGSSGMPPAPERWEEVLAALEKVHGEFAALLGTYSDEQFAQTVKFFTGPGQLGDWTREKLAWFLLHDQIHHRGQFSIYLRMADGKVPSIYGPSGDEPWF